MSTSHITDSGLQFYIDPAAKLLLFLAALVLYMTTLAPTIVYGDSAKFMMHIDRLYLGMGANDHPLYILLGKLFTLLPLGSAPFRVGVMSALCAALTLQLVYRISLQLTGSWRAALVAAGALAVSQTFWFHAVTIEVYQLHIFFVTLQLYLLLLWTESRKPVHLAFFCFVLALSFDHLMAVLNLPAYIFLVLSTDWRVLIRKKDMLYVVSGFLAGLPLYAIAFFLSMSRGSFVEAVLESSALSHSEHMFSYPLPVLLHFVGEYAKYLAYQFPFMGFFLGLWGLFLLRKQSTVFVTLLLMYLANVIFVLNYHETNDVFALYLPSYLVFALWIGYGFHGLLNSISSRTVVQNIALLLAGLLLVGLPVATYYTLPRLLHIRGLELTGARSLPMRDATTYYLWPPKRGYDTAFEYGVEVCSLVKPKAVILEDNGNLARLVLYQQQILGVRPDVDVVHMNREDVLNAVKQYISTRPVYLFSLEENFYPVSELREKYDLFSRGNNLLYEVIEK